MRFIHRTETCSGMPFVLPGMKEIVCPVYWVCSSMTASLHINTAKWYYIWWCLRSVIPVLRSNPFLINSVTKTEEVILWLGKKTPPQTKKNTTTTPNNKGLQRERWAIFNQDIYKYLVMCLDVCRRMHLTCVSKCFHSKSSKVISAKT